MSGPDFAAWSQHSQDHAQRLQRMFAGFSALYPAASSTPQFYVRDPAGYFLDRMYGECDTYSATLADVKSHAHRQFRDNDPVHVDSDRVQAHFFNLCITRAYVIV
jgi:hypothetical protein